MFRPHTSALLALSALLISNAAAQTPHLSPLTTFGPNGDGTVRPGDVSFLTTGNTERGMAWNPVTGHVLVVSRSDMEIHIMDGATGAALGTLDVSGTITGGNSQFPINMIAIADDGAIYVANLSNSDFPPKFNLYRWADEAAAQTPIFNGSLRDVSNGNSINSAGYRRYGDTLTVRGEGTNTQVLTASRGTNVSILYPTDTSMANWQSCNLHATNLAAGDMGYGIAFGTNNTFYATQGSFSGGPLFRLGFDMGDGTNGSITVLQSWPRSQLPGGISVLGTSVASNLLAGIDMIPGPDLVRLYDIANAPALPVFLDRSSFVTDTTNSEWAGSLAFTTNNILYALDEYNGLRAFSIISSSDPVIPSVFLQPVSATVQAGLNVNSTTAADGTAPLTYRWYHYGSNLLFSTSNSLALTSVQASNAGAYTLVVSNIAGNATSQVATLTVTANSPGTLELYEPFNYTANQLLTTANPNIILNGSGNDTFVVTGNLAYNGLPPSVGNSITNGGSGAAVRIPLNATNNSASMYYSFIMRVNALGAGFTAINGFIAAFNNNTNTGGEYGCRLTPRTNIVVGKYDLGISKGAGNTVFTNLGGFSDGETLFIVARYTFNTGSSSDDSVSLWINPDSSTFGQIDPPPPIITTSAGSDMLRADYFTYRQNSVANTPGNIQYDELRVGTGWSVVTPVGPPSLSVSLVTTNAILAWPTNATAGYALQSMAGLDDPNGWVNVANPVTIVGTSNTVAVPAKGTIKLFRLIQ